MSTREQNVPNKEARNSSRSRDPNDYLSNNQHGRRGDIARKTVEPRLGFATKAARKTFALPPSDLDSQEDEPSDRSTHMPRSAGADDRPVFATKSGQTMSATSRGKDLNQPISKATRKVTFNPDTQAHAPPSRFEGRPVPDRGLFGHGLSVSSQTRPPFVSKSTSHAMSHRDPFFGGPPDRATAPTRLAQPQIVTSPRPTHGSGILTPRISAHSSNSLSSSRFVSSSAGGSISSASRGFLSKGTRYSTPPSKSRPLPSLEAAEDATWRKSFSPRKISATYSVINPPPRMVAPSMSAPRRTAMRTSVADELHPEDVGSTFFLGRNMTIYENTTANDSDIEEISSDPEKRVLSRAKATNKTMSTMQVGRKAGRENGASSGSSSSDSNEETPEESNESSEDEMSSDAHEPDTESEGEVSQRPASPSNNLVAALEVHALSSLRMQKTRQLPFLLRNMRRGFANRCIQLGTGVFEDAEDYSDEYITRMTSWNCPLCDLHGRFGTQAMLQKHIEWDHSEIKARWMHDSRKSMWTITLYIPKRHLDQEFGVLLIGNATQREPSRLHSPPPSVAISSPVASPVLSTAQLGALPVQESPVHSKLKRQVPSPPRSVTRSTSQTSFTSRSRSATLTTSRLQTREPSYQPPLDDPLGPSTQKPYLPEFPEDGQLYFSCRPGGARIYDLLNTLPLAPFGVLSWYIVDREEEMFELDDVLDEDKVMQALWGRWILLNHRKFLANYCQGTVAFINEYWRMIHRAAGWAALRAWLLMFVVNRFLTGSEVARILRHYESLTNMDSWYTKKEL